MLRINNLTVDYIHQGRAVSAVRHVSLDISPGRTIGLVGESGCGKTTLALTIMGLLPENESRISSGEIIFHGVDLPKLTREEMRKRRGSSISMIFQDPFSALNPVMTVRNQIEETLLLDQKNIDPLQARILLEEVQLTEADRILASYPHQLSGGQRQRALIAMALARRPELLIADEPTTALDVIVQDEIIKLLVRLQKSKNMAMVFVTHNLGLIRMVADEIAVMYAGEIVEHGNVDDILKNPQHPYTQGLLRSLPSLKRPDDALPMLDGQPPEPGHLPLGCPFHPRCEKRFSPCSVEDPKPRKSAQQMVRCHLY